MIRKILLSLFSIVFLLLVLEVGIRVYGGEYRLKNFLEDYLTLLEFSYSSEFDQDLGWVPKIGFSGINYRSNTEVNISEDGIRSNGNKKSPDLDADTDLILAVGDSYTFGDDVSDWETWPAILETISNKRVINGGVSAYGLDQSFLRMKSLMPKYNPDVVIISFIPNDIRRSELSSRNSKHKPYFEVKNGNLILRKDHIVLPPEKKLDSFRKTLGYSFLAHNFMMKYFYGYWIHGVRESIKAHSDGSDVACLIFEELKGYVVEERIKEAYVLIQYTKSPDAKFTLIKEKLLGCVDQNYLTLIDLEDYLISLKSNNMNRYNNLYNSKRGHMSPDGNRFVAEVLYENMTNSDN